jgi:hypothetical protein
MNWEIKDLMCDIEVSFVSNSFFTNLSSTNQACLVATSLIFCFITSMSHIKSKHAWFVEDRFVKNELETKREHINFSASYLEHRIQNEHTVSDSVAKLTSDDAFSIS